MKAARMAAGQPQPTPKPPKLPKKVMRAAQPNLNRLSKAVRGNPVGSRILQRLMDMCCVEGVIIPRKLEYLAALLAPREGEHIRLPDPWTREETATYQAKREINIVGCQGATINNTGDVGRFSIILNPVIDAGTPTFNTVQSNWEVAVQDGNSGATTGINWSSYWIAPNSATNFFTYYADPLQTTFCNSNNNGLMMRCRPVSASILCSYNGKILDGGGNIAAAWVAGDWWITRAVSNVAGTGNMCNWENLAGLKGAYDGPLNKGAYVVWAPNDESDTLLRSTANGATDKMSEHGYPMLVVAGQVSAPTGGFAGSTQLRVDCYINFEYGTDSRAVECLHGSKDISERTLAYAAIAKSPLSMANGDHIDWIRVILGGVLGFALRGRTGALIGAASGGGISLSKALFNQ